ncbi:uncharacterized protein PG998_002924 [Apiospora kogelbergensis]|uniref:uncharacterized protein n=1 Tax=Apiospora kogelbergensis TaxID=1337665 RepID=UPI00313101AD
MCGSLLEEPGVGPIASSGPDHPVVSIQEDIFLPSSMDYRARMALVATSDTATSQSSSCLDIGNLGSCNNREGDKSDNTVTTADNIATSNKIIPEPKTTPISQEQLKAETAGIYAGLTMVERACMDLVYKTFRQTGLDLSNGQWEALNKLHNNLLNEHHDMFLASQHPVALQAIRSIPGKLCMDMRLWKHAIHAYLEILKRHSPENREHMMYFIYQAYSMLAQLDETVVGTFSLGWLVIKAEIARYRVDIAIGLEDEGQDVRQRWITVSEGIYTHALNKNPMAGYLYHQMTLLRNPVVENGFDQSCFDGIVPSLFYGIKSLVVTTPYIPARKTLFQFTNRAINGTPTTEIDHFATAVAHLIHVYQIPEIRVENGDRMSTEDHRLAFNQALVRIVRSKTASTTSEMGIQAEMLPHSTKEKRQWIPYQQHGSDTNVEAGTLRPSAMLGLLLCQLLLQTPPPNEQQNLLMAACASGFTTSTDRATLTTNEAHELVSTTINKLLQRANTGDIRLWEFIHMLLVSMSSLTTQSIERGLISETFHPELLAPILTMILRKGGPGGKAVSWESVSQPKYPARYTPLNREKRPGEYGIGRTTGTGDVANMDLLGADQLYTNPLPEDDLLRGYSFARQAEAPEAEPLPDFVTAPSATPNSRTAFDKPVPGKSDGAFTVMEYADKIPCSCSLPPNWFENSRYSFEENQARQEAVQDIETVRDRWYRILWLASQLMGTSDETEALFALKTDDDGRQYISIPGALHDPQPEYDGRMPEICERHGIQFVWVDPSLAEKEDVGKEAKLQQEPEQ